MKILITGTTGFIGKHLMSRLIEQKYENAILVRNFEKAQKLFKDKVYIIEYDMDSFEYIDKICHFNPEIIIHLATYYTVADDINEIQKLLEANIGFTTHLCSALEGSKIKLFINTGSFFEYYDGDGKINPAYLYSSMKVASRYIIEYFGNKHNYNVLHVIPYSVYGKNGTVKKIFDYIIDATISGEYIEMTEGKQILDFIHVDDVVDFYCTLIEKQNLIHAPISEYHLGTGRGTSIRELANIVETIVGRKANIGWGKRPYRTRDIMHAVAPVSRLKQDFGWEANISVSEGMRRFVDSIIEKGRKNACC
jgi:nucleoside-diphosphate-sugar epimerase